MFFTQDDYKKIQQWLIKNSVKDTEFNEANIPFNGEEIITVVQGNQNKRIFLKDLVNQLFSIGICDFVNVTDKYNAPNISLEEAIRLLPSIVRREGQVITFLNKENNWQIYQFKGDLTQWNILDLWEDLFDWEKLIIDSILPDEEDLTKSLPDENGNSYLSLKDREYNPEDFSGLGRIILRKNIVDIEDPIYCKVKKNVLYQDMFTQSNTVYEIRYDFDLNGAEITIPEGCVLDFQGGSLNNGSVVGNNTIIEASPVKIFDTNIKLSGSWNVTESYPEWFKDKTGDDWTLAINKALSYFNLVRLTKSSYKVSDTLLMRFNTVLKGCGSAKTTISFANTSSSLNKRILSYGEAYDYNGDRGSVENLSFSATSNLQWKGMICYSSIKIYDVGFSNLRSAIKITGDYVDRVIIDRCHFYWCIPSSSDTEYVVDLSPVVGDCYNITNNHLVCFGISLSNGVDYYGMRLQNLSATNMHSNIINAPIVAVNCEGLNINGLHQEYKGEDDGNIPGVTFERVIGSVSNSFVYACTKGTFHIKAGSEIGRTSIHLSNIGFFYTKNRIKHLVDVGQIIKDSGTLLEIDNCYLKDGMNSVGQHQCVGIRIQNNEDFNKLSYLASIKSTIGLNNEVVLPNFTNLVGSDANCYYSGRNTQVICDNDEYTKTMMYHTLAIVDFERRLSLGNSQGKLIEASSKPDGVLLSMLSLGNTPMNLLVCKKETSSWVDTFKKYTIVPCSMKTQYLKDNGTSVNTYKFIELEEEFSINSFTKITKYYYSQDGKNIVIFRSSPISNGTFVNGDIIINDGTAYKTKQWIYKDGVWLDDNYNPYNAAVSGSSSSRPSNINNGFFYFDTTLNKPIWWTGTKWVDATGADV